MDCPWLNCYEQGVLAHLEYPSIPLFQFLTDSAKTRSEKNAMLFYGKGISYRELEEASNCFAHALIKLGVKKGDRVAIMLPNVPQCVVAYYGALKSGAVVVMTNPLYTERELLIQLADSGAEIVVTLDLFFPKIDAIKKETALKSVVLTSVQEALPWFLGLLYPIKAKKEGQWIHIVKAPPVYDMGEMIRDAPPIPPNVTVVPDDLALLQYTGGTTGSPKGVMLTHRNLVTNTLQCRNWMPDLKAGEEVFLSVIPFFHVYGMSTCMNLAIYLGSTLVLLPKFVTKDVLCAIKKNRPTIFMGVQAMYVAINNFPGVNADDLSSIHTCISGAGPLHLEVQRRFEALTGGKLVEGYGLSETSPVTHVNPIRGRRKEGSIGLPISDTLARVVDLETGTKPLPVGESGELIIQGPQVMQGYWNKPKESSDVLRDRWLYTGDIARMDEDGYFFIVDRKKDMIKSRGENVYPREVEEVLYRHPKVAEAVVVGLPDPFLGEMIKAYIVLKEGVSATPEEVTQFCRGELAKFKVPQQIEFREGLPKTVIGKVLRRVLIEEEMKKVGK